MATRNSTRGKRPLTPAARPANAAERDVPQKGAFTADAESHLYRALGLSGLIYGAGLQNFREIHPHYQDAVLWLLHAEIDQAFNAYQAEPRGTK